MGITLYYINISVIRWMQLTLHLEITFLNITFITCSLNVVRIIKSSDSFDAFLILNPVSSVMIVFGLNANVPYTALLITVWYLIKRCVLLDIGQIEFTVLWE